MVTEAVQSSAVDFESLIEQIFNLTKKYAHNQEADSTPPPQGTPPGASSLPPLSAPLGGLSLENLVKALGFAVRQSAVHSGIESIEARNEEQKATGEKQLNELIKQLEAKEKQKSLSTLSKIFNIIGTIIGAIASIASVAVGVVTANPLLIAGGVIGCVMAIDSTMSLATDGKVCLNAGITQLAKACGASDEEAKWIAFGVEMAIIVVQIALSIGGAAKAAKAAQEAAKVAQSTQGVMIEMVDLSKGASTTSTVTSSCVDVVDTSTRVAQQTTKAWNVITKSLKWTQYLESGLTVAKGGVTIAAGSADSEVTKSRARQKEFEAILEMIRSAIENDEALVKAEAERAAKLMELLTDMVEVCNNANISIMTAPAMA